MCLSTKMFFYCVFLIFSANCQSLKSPEISALSELSLDRLLEVKNSFLEKDIQQNDNSTENLPRPEALQGLNKRKQNDRGGYHTYVYENDYKSDKKDVQSIFQVSVTTLAFLAFGGYLLCLLCQAISANNNNNNNNTASTQVVQAIIKSQNIRRGTRRPNTNRRPTSYRKKYPNRNNNYLRPRPRVKRDVIDESDGEKMYWALIRLSEGYAGYHTIEHGGSNTTYNDYLDF